MDPLSTPTLLAEKIVFRDRNADLPAATRLLVLEKIARFVYADGSIERMLIELERDDIADPEARFTAKGQLDLREQGLLSSVAGDEPMRALDILLDKFDRQLRRYHRPRAVTQLAP